MNQNPKIDTAEFVQYASKRLYKFESTAKAIAMAWNANQYILLYGKPGYGKSEIFKCFVDFLVSKGITEESQVFTIPFNENTDADKLFGMDMKHFQETGVIKFNPKNSFANYQIVRGEEIFDANKNTLAALKLALMDKAIDDGESRFAFRTLMFMGMTNADLKDLEEMNDAQTNAILDRFPHKVCVDWATDSSKESMLRNHGMVDYSEAFKLNMPNVSPSVRDIFAQVCAEATTANVKNDGRPISPRTAYLAFSCFISNDKDWDCLNSFVEFPPIVVSQAKMEFTKSKLSEGLSDLINEFEKEAEVIKNFVATKRTDLKDETIYHVLRYAGDMQVKLNMELKTQIISNTLSVKVAGLKTNLSTTFSTITARFGLTADKLKMFNETYKDRYDSKKARKLLGLDA